MRTARAPPAEPGPSSSRRAQPVRQTRTNPPRTTAGPSRSHGGRESLGAAHGHDQPIDIFPAITHFTDAITSLPKDLVRHFTLLKEVDAKIFAPEETLFQLVDQVLTSRPPEPQNANDASPTIATASTPMSAQNSSSGFATGSHHPAGSADENYNPSVHGPTNLERRHMVHRTAYKIQEMLVSLEEKNHVISTANDALSKQLNRINDVWPHLENEFSDEAKWGSTTHWAYPENNRAQKASQADRSRRDGAAMVTAAAQQLVAEEAAARSDARKQAMMAKKGLKHQQHLDSEDDHETKQKSDSTKKGHGSSKARKAAEAAPPVGLGITTGTTTNGNPPSKRRKVENTKATNGGQPMERAMSLVFGGSAAKTKNSSPRATPAPEPPKKRKALPTANGVSKKSKTAIAAAAPSPSTVSSPAQPNVADAKAVGRGSPPPSGNASRPASSRARQNSIQSGVETNRQRPASAASNKPNGTVAAPPPEVAPTQNGSRPSVEPRPSKETIAPLKTEHTKEETNPNATPGNTNGGSKKEGPAKVDEVEPKGEAAIPPPAPTTTTTTTVVTTKSGRASKPSTPALGSFPDQAPPRSRSSRTTSGTTAKRSHKKGANHPAIPPRVTDGDARSSGQGDDEGDVDADEPLYCYCNGVSYGEMVACDAEDCEREWFHLDCVGLKAAPSLNMKWFCDHCKERLKSGKKVNGR
ncbi:hypothetical protein GGR56DRAFT_613983 [Xylariaceae sp. FL0804]|nr:hypothetical protein GGR56DRAFT_613983 [Xylariaceae sp. FL0804]